MGYKGESGVPQSLGEEVVGAEAFLEAAPGWEPAGLVSDSSLLQLPS